MAGVVQNTCHSSRLDAICRDTRGVLPRHFSRLLVAWHLLVDSWLMKEGKIQ